MTKAQSRQSKPPRRSKWRRRLWIFALASPVVVVVLWVALHRIPGVAPVVADTLRAVIGVENVTRLENLAYRVEDRVNRWIKSGEKPKAHWTVPPATATKTEPTPTADAGPPEIAPFRPKDVGPMHESWSAPGDGQWVAMPDARAPDRDPLLYKTLLHPDRNRSWAELFVVAVDLRRTDLHLVPGKYEPKSFEKEGVLYKDKRTGTIPEAHRDRVVAAFNGGFKTEHGWYGMKIDDVVLVKPRQNACTVAKYDDGRIRVGSWKLLEEAEPKMVWWRQTPGCLYEHGQMHVGLSMELNTAWGATLDGETVIRRSAIGLSKDRKTLFVGITNATTAVAVAKGMHFAGASDVAQLDVNFSYPKFVTYERGDAGNFVAVALADGFELTEDEYIRRVSHRDFFYLLPKDPEDYDRSELAKREPDG